MNKIKRGKERIVEPLSIPNKKSDTFVLETPRRDLSKLVTSDKTLQQIKNIISKIQNYDLLYNKFGLKDIDPSGGRTAINLYGPPGTGKSFAAEAIANALNKKIIRVNYAEIESKYVGDTPKNIKLLFSEAKKADAILIFDEADSILGNRLSNVSQSTDHAVNVSKSVMLLELDNFSGITIFTTNFGSNYDSAFVRRIIGHIKFTLPNSENRKKLFRGMIPNKLPIQLSEKDFLSIIDLTEGFSGGDLLNVVIYASSQAVERDGENCKVGINDFVDAISLIKTAKREIGINSKK
ncbi:ATP-binding protein [Lactobacillus mellis]|uniref:ATP-binding protein n=1 Tax=Bombilactobacillus mellis TaxID=1218508 RepID=UPI001580D585|nr:ATP-binding protein [Bombilactobacillus mellis]NUG38685.1 ATP-binding protein [Bombilactobacillus mellis]